MIADCVAAVGQADELGLRSQHDSPVLDAFVFTLGFIAAGYYTTWDHNATDPLAGVVALAATSAIKITGAINRKLAWWKPLRSAARRL